MTTAEDPLAGRAERLLAAVDDVLAAWVEREIVRLVIAHRGSVDDTISDKARRAGLQARAEIVPTLRALLATDAEQPRTNPLAVLRGAVSYPTEVLRSAGVPPVVRDAVAVEQFPDDDYDLTPGSFADIDETLSDPGIEWGAAKAHVIITRRRNRS